MTEPRLGGDVYNIDYYVNKALALEKMGADTICIKDMAGLIAPYDAYNIIKSIKEKTDVPVHLHSHFTSGLSPMSHLKAVEAGVDIIDTCMSPYAYRTSHPALEPLVMALIGTNRDTGFDIKKLAGINEVLEKEIMPKYKHLLADNKMSVIDINVLLHQTPGGMLSNLINQLREMDALDKIDEVYKELPRVRKDLGQIPLVTPTSQIVGIQTVNNVLFDDENERYKMITAQVKDLCYGLYGKTAVPINAEVQKKALKGYPRGETPITCRPAEVLEPELAKAQEEVKGLAVDIDDEILYAIYPVTGKKFLKWKYGKEEPPKEVLARSLEEALQEQEAYLQAKDEVPETRLLFNNQVTLILEVATQVLAGEIEYRRGNHDRAFEHLREAVVLDQRLNYDEPWGWMEPARHALGALLTEQGRFEEAVAVYEANLARYPENGWALHGLTEGLRRLGREDEAAAAQARFDAAWANSDTVIPGSCFCRTGG